MTDPNDLRKIEKWMAENKADKMLTIKEPVAWMVQNDDGERWLCHNHPAAAKYGLRCVPLFAKPQPTLTDAEREAIEWARKWITTMVVPSAGLAHAHAESLRKLLERLK